MCRPKHVEQLRSIGIINSTTRPHLVCSLYEMNLLFYERKLRFVNDLLVKFKINTFELKLKTLKSQENNKSLKLFDID
jgi:hypothetical protein